VLSFHALLFCHISDKKLEFKIYSEKIRPDNILTVDIRSDSQYRTKTTDKIEPSKQVRHPRATVVKNYNRSATAINTIKPEYPILSRRMQEEGIVTVQATITAQGRVEAVKVLRSTGFHRLDHAAIAALKDASFRPAIEQGQMLASIQEFTFKFILNDIKAH